MPTKSAFDQSLYRAASASGRFRHQRHAVLLLGMLALGGLGCTSTPDEHAAGTREGAAGESEPQESAARDGGTSERDGPARVDASESPSRTDSSVGTSDPASDAATSPVDAGAIPDPQTRDVTFFVTSDTHIGRPDLDAKKASMTMIAAMHATEGTAYPAELGLSKVGIPAGVVITGDLTNENYEAEWDEFDGIWGANGEGAIRYPVFEGWGNHDLHRDAPYVRAGVLARHKVRKHQVYVGEGKGAHYSWDVHDVHFVHLNLYPGVDGGLGLDSPKLYNPQKSLNFLAQDLATRVGNSGRPVVIFFHFPCTKGDRGWAESERDAFFDALSGYNVAGIFVGHAHAQGFAEVQSSKASASDRKYQMYMADDTISAGTGVTGFYVVHLGPKEIVVAERKVGGKQAWGFVRKTALAAP